MTAADLVFVSWALALWLGWMLRVAYVAGRIDGFREATQRDQEE